MPNSPARVHMLLCPHLAANCAFNVWAAGTLYPQYAAWLSAAYLAWWKDYARITNIA